MSLLFNMLSSLVITFLPRSKRLLISWLQSPSAVILEPKKIKSNTVSTVSPSICHEVVGPDAMIFVFWILSFKPTFPLSSFTFLKRLFSSSSLSAIRVVSYWKVVVESREYTGFLAPGGEEFNPGPETRLDRSELLCNKVLSIKEIEKASDIGIRRGRKSTRLLMLTMKLYNPKTVRRL